MAEVPSIILITQDRWSVPSSMSQTSLQTEEAFTVKEYKHTNTHTHTHTHTQSVSFNLNFSREDFQRFSLLDVFNLPWVGFTPPWNLISDNVEWGNAVVWWKTLHHGTTSYYMAIHNILYPSWINFKLPNFKYLRSKRETLLKRAWLSRVEPFDSSPKKHIFLSLPSPC